MKQVLFAFVLLLSNLSIAQNFEFVPSGLDKGNEANLEKFVSVNDNAFIIIEKTTTKPMGLKPYLYSFDSENSAFSSEQIGEMKHMEVYKKFFVDGFRVIEVNERYFNVIVTFDKGKANEYVFSVDLQEFDLITLADIADPIRIIDGEKTMNDGNFIFISEKNHFAVIKSGQTSITRLMDGEGVDVFVFNANDFELSYKQSISFSTGEQSGHLEDLRLDDDGTVFILSSLKNNKEKIKATEKPLGDLAVTQVSKGGVVKRAFNSNKVLNIQLNEHEGTYPYISCIGLNEDRDQIKVYVVSSNLGDQVLSEKEISIAEILDPQNANFTNKFRTIASNSDELLVTVEPLNFSIRSLTTNSGKTIMAYPIMIAPPVGLGFDNLFCTVVVLIDQDGLIKWTQVIPVEQSLLTLIDQDENIHLYANGILNEYENGVYVSDNKRGVNEEYIPVEIILDAQSGEILSNKRFSEGTVPSGNAFSAFLGGINFDENHGFIGCVGQQGQKELGSLVNNNITFGLIKMTEEK